MYYTADSPFSTEDSLMAENIQNNNKGFENIDTSDYGLESESGYQDLLFGTMTDQAVPSSDCYKLPPCNVSYTSMAPQSYVGTSMGDSIPLGSSIYESNYHSQLHTFPNYQSMDMSSESSGRGSIIMGGAVPPPEPEKKPRRKGGRKPKNDPLPPHLEERRRLRRIRNKDAAQKCRERRLAYTDELTSQIDELEKQNRRTEALIESMREYKEQCEFLLNSHRAHCNRNARLQQISPLTFKTPCSIAHHRSSSSEGDLHSPSQLVL